MRSCEDECLCQEAQVHYYDLLCQEEAAVPARVRRHVVACPVCREKMRRLRENLFEAQRPARPAGVWQDETVEALAQQFQLLDERVTCSQVKPRLPELALESPQIRIPTPITVHVDHCPPCAADLAAIRELHLTADQLKRLGRLLNGRRGAPSKRGRKARATAIPESGSLEAAASACHEIAMADLFDCVVPSDSGPCGAKTARERQKAIARHVQSCPACLAKARTLQRTIGAIAARGDSEVATVYHADKDLEEVGSEYSYPVSVEVLHSASEAAGEAHDMRPARATGLRKLKRSAKPLAALVLVGVALTLLLHRTTPTVSGINLGDMDKILAKMETVHVATRDWQGRLIQELWMAPQAETLAMKTRDSWVWNDLARGRRRTLNLLTGERTSERLGSNDCDKARQFMADYLSRMAMEVAPDMELHRADEIDRGAGQVLDIYVLPLPDSPSHDRRLIYLDRATGLPQRMEFYRSTPGLDPEEPQTTTIFTYPSGPAMDEILQEFLRAP